MSYKLEQWGVCVRMNDSYQAPELGGMCLEGVVSGHPRFPNNHAITTSLVKKLHKDNTVETHSGSVYELGEPSADYVNWCKKQGCHVPTKEQPILP